MLCASFGQIQWPQGCPTQVQMLEKKKWTSQLSVNLPELGDPGPILRNVQDRKRARMHALEWMSQEHKEMWTVLYI